MANKLSTIVNSSFCLVHLNITIPKKIHIHTFIFIIIPEKDKYFLVVTAGEWYFCQNREVGGKGMKGKSFTFYHIFFCTILIFLYSAYTLKFLKRRTK